MRKVNKVDCVAKNAARVSCSGATSKVAREKSVVSSIGASALTFSHRTPTQLHASTYVLGKS